MSPPFLSIETLWGKQTFAENGLEEMTDFHTTQQTLNLRTSFTNGPFYLNSNSVLHYAVPPLNLISNDGHFSLQLIKVKVRVPTRACALPSQWITRCRKQILRNWLHTPHPVTERQRKDSKVFFSSLKCISLIWELFMSNKMPCYLESPNSTVMS